MSFNQSCVGIDLLPASDLIFPNSLPNSNINNSGLSLIAKPVYLNFNN